MESSSPDLDAPRPFPLWTAEEWGVMYPDGRVRRGFNGRNAARLARIEARLIARRYPNIKVRVVRRDVVRSPWEEVCDQPEEQ